MAAPKKAWSRPELRRLDLSQEQISKLFPEYKPVEPRAGRVQGDYRKLA